MEIQFEEKIAKPMQALIIILTLAGGWSSVVLRNSNKKLLRATKSMGLVTAIVVLLLLSNVPSGKSSEKVVTVKRCTFDAVPIEK